MTETPPPIVTFPAHHRLQRAGWPATRAFQVVRGRVMYAAELMRNIEFGACSNNGHLILAYAWPGQIVGFEAALEENPLFALSAWVSKHCELMPVETASIPTSRALGEQKLLLSRLAVQSARMVREEVPRRVTRSLAMHAWGTLPATASLDDIPEQGVYVEVMIKELAMHTGCSREMTGRVLNRLKVTGRIKRYGQKRRILVGKGLMEQHQGVDA